MCDATGTCMILYGGRADVPSLVFSGSLEVVLQWKHRAPGAAAAGGGDSLRPRAP